MKNHIFLRLGLVAVALLGLSACTSGTPDPTAHTGIPTVYAENAGFQYESYTDEKFDDLLGNEAFTVFVHSKSCGTCKRKDKQIINEVGEFQSGVILKMEYANAPMDFKKEYGVTGYDTFVLFDADGNHTTKKGASISEVRDAL